MINLEFLDDHGDRIGMEYDVHPRSQQEEVPIPDGAVAVRIWLGTR